jgi:hypothetical protein
MKMPRKKFVLDERSIKNLEETAMDVLVLFYIVCPIEMLIKVNTTHNSSSVIGEVIILFSITATFTIVHRLDKDYSPTLPRKNNGEQLSAEKTRRAKQKRMLIYAKESIINATGLIIGWIGLDCFLQNQSITWNLTFFVNKFIYIIIGAIIFFIINSISKERRIKDFNKSNEKLDK